MFGGATLSDDMVCAAAEGSERDFAHISEAILPQVRVMVLARLIPTTAQLPAVDDTTQEVMLALTEGISRLERRTVSGLKSFVSGIVKHKVCERLRRPKAETDGGCAQSLDSTVTTLSEAGPLWQFLSAGGTSPSGVAARAALVAKFFAELRTLKPAYREVITLALIDELPTRDIAREMGISRNAAAMALKRAGKALRRGMRIQHETDRSHEYLA